MDDVIQGVLTGIGIAFGLIIVGMMSKAGETVKRCFYEAQNFQDQTPWESVKAAWKCAWQ